jgi:ketosteroid isomerase-like protein
LFIALTGPLAADEVADGLRAAEIAFAASVADRDLEAFSSFLDKDAVFIGATVLRGHEAMSVFFAEGGPELTWHPELVELRPDGLGLSRGPYTLTATGQDGSRSESSGTFTSIWRRGEDGGWKVLFDAGCPPCAAAGGQE